MSDRIEATGVCLVTAKKERPFMLSIGRRQDFANSSTVVIDMEMAGVPAARIFLSDYQLRQLTEALAVEVKHVDQVDADRNRMFENLCKAQGADNAA